MPLVTASENGTVQTESRQGRCGVISLFKRPGCEAEVAWNGTTTEGDSPVRRKPTRPEHVSEYRALDIAREFGGHQPPKLNTTLRPIAK